MAFRSIFFAHGYEAIPLLEMVNCHDVRTFLDYIVIRGMADFDGELRDRLCAGNYDMIIRDGRFIVSYNSRLRYIGIEREEKI